MTKTKQKTKSKELITLKEVIWESIGVFMLTFIMGYSSLIPSTEIAPGSVNLTGISLCNYAILVIFISLAGPTSGAHFNPIVSITAMVLKKKTVISTILYVVVQLLASIFGGFCIHLLHDEGYNTSFGYPKLNPGIPVIKGFFFELIGSSILTFVIFFAALNQYSTFIIANLVGLTVAFLINSIGPLTGASMNPARTFGPAVFDTEGEGFFRRGWWIYYIATLIGGILGGILAKFMADGEDEDKYVDFRVKVRRKEMYTVCDTYGKELVDNGICGEKVCQGNEVDLDGDIENEEEKDDEE